MQYEVCSVHYAVCNVLREVCGAECNTGNSLQCGVQWLVISGKQCSVVQIFVAKKRSAKCLDFSHPPYINTFFFIVGLG